MDLEHNAMNKNKLSPTDIKTLIVLQKMSQSRVKCLNELITHELQTQSKLITILQNNCNHKWLDVGSFTIENNCREYECEVCGITKKSGDNF